MKYLGVDYGTKKTGIAISDEEGSFAFPKDIVATENLFEYLDVIFKQEDIEAIVIGQSLATNGEENELAQKVQNIGKKIEEKTGKNIFFIREDFSSVEAHRYQTKKGNRDDSAAAIILQRFLDKKKN
ncbi:MAG: Holliday junction resolvase RuvX [Candidatus Pacebacteria bacterium]|nr:Holliday junction resolvase RuvX [Candidatus Paceibacterota bacterium]